MILNLTKLSKAYVRQITKDDSTKSALSCLALNQAVLFNLLTADDFNVDGTPDLNAFTTKLTKSRDAMRSINMVRQESRLWGGSISNKSLLQFLSLGYLAPDINQEPNRMTCLGFAPHHERHNCVFQEFATDLSRFAEQMNPLRSASSSLRGGGSEIQQSRP